MSFAKHNAHPINNNLKYVILFLDYCHLQIDQSMIALI